MTTLEAMKQALLALLYPDDMDSNQLNAVAHNLNQAIVEMEKHSLQEIVTEVETFFDKKFRNTKNNSVWTLQGVMVGSDDYYYVVSSPNGGVGYLSCVGNLASYDLELIDEELVSFKEIEK